MKDKQTTQKNPVTYERILTGLDTLKDYKRAKLSLEERIIEDELWWRLRHWEVLRRKKSTLLTMPEPSSAWLFNSLINKHADIMDSFPEPVCLPRSADDKDTARIISSVLPVIIEQNDFEKTYSDNNWYKLKHGVCAYGVFWNSSKENGIGDVDIKRIDVLNIFWQPGISDIQDSSNLFIVNLIDKDKIFSAYPGLKKQLLRTNDKVIELGSYAYDDSINTDDKFLVIDWYYKKIINGVTRLHYCKLIGDILLYASENDPLYADRGWYDHGTYPVIFDVLYPEEATPFGFGIIAITKNPQTYIDKMDSNLLENMDWATRIRYFGKKSMGINENDFLDLDRRIVEVEGDISEERLRQITVAPFSDVYLALKKQKIDELKETSCNRDFSQGSVTGGVTAASAIAALQEAGNKNSRDMIASSNRAFVKIVTLIIELLRQFYTERHTFRIIGDGGDGYDFISFDNSLLNIYSESEGDNLSTSAPSLYRRPIFDVDIKARKRNPYSRLSQNELAKELYSLGVFDQGNEEKALALLDIMDFDGIEKTREQIRSKLEKNRGAFI